MSRNDGGDRRRDADAGNHEADRADDDQAEESRAERIPRHVPPLPEFAPVDQNRNQRDDRAAKMHDEHAFEESQPLGDHACHGTLQSDGNAARKTDEEDEEDGFHVVFLCDEMER